MSDTNTRPLPTEGPSAGGDEFDDLFNYDADVNDPFSENYVAPSAKERQREIDAAAKAKGISYFRNLEELNKKESKRLNWGSKILNMIGVKNKLTRNHGIKIWGQPNLKLNKNYEIKNYLKDHRVMAMSTIAALTLGGKWKIHNPESIKTSFPSFFKIIQKDLGGKINR